jgi:BirA family biotin operon repressor/biotin-[acetyl-CoA-carboxylase] ligase
LQTAGRGRLGRAWFSPPGAGLYVSVVLRETGSEVPPLVSLAAGVALAEAVRACTRLPVDIKWPNDLVVGQRKLAGILAEASGGPTIEYVVLGFGINLRSAAYPPDIADRATSIETELGRGVDRGVLLAECLASLLAWNDAIRAGKGASVLERWRALSPSCRGNRVEWTTATGIASGITDGIDGDGALLVRTGDRVERVLAGEVRFLCY